MEEQSREPLFDNLMGNMLPAKSISIFVRQAFNNPNIHYCMLHIQLETIRIHKIGFLDDMETNLSSLITYHFFSPEFRK